MAYLLFPGRHLVNTRFQEEYLFRHARPPVDHIVFAITSCNQSHSRYNPVPFHVRAIGVDRFARAIAPVLGIPYTILGIPHHGPTPRFAELVVKEVEEQTEGQIVMSPANTRVLCSTPELMAQYAQLGYEILPAEARKVGPDRFVIQEATPIEIIRRIGFGSPEALEDDWIREKLHPASLSVLQDFPTVLRTVQSLYREPLLGEEGSITETRDYDSYVKGMSGAIELKYSDIKAFLLPGRIIDEGCADGALLARIASDFPDSDLIGVDLSAEMLARAAERQREGQFSGCFVFFRQCNLMKPLLLRRPVDTVICNSTLHEIWSYGRGAESVLEYLTRKRDQLRRGGRLVARDVVGPDDRAREVLLWCNPRDGADDAVPSREEQQPKQQHLDGLSTRALFRRFAADFLPQQGGRAFPWSECATTTGEPAFQLPLEYAMEFITKMGYTDNWQAEMQERFCFWDFNEWKEAFRAAGFNVLEASRSYLNEWRVEHCFEGRAALYDLHGHRLPFPVTNMVLVGEKA